MADEQAPIPALFGEAEVRTSRPGVVAADYDRLVRAGLENGSLVDEDRALIEAVRVGAEVLDTARRLGGAKGGYLWVQAMAPFQRGLHALRLPVELSAVSQPDPTPERRGGWEDALRDAFGSAE